MPGLSPWPFLLAMAGTAVMVMRARRYSDIALVGLASVAFLGYFGFKAGTVHVPEWTHYYLGSKYTAELSYDRLYECLAVADIQDGVIKQGDRLLMTDLRTNRASVGAIDNPAACTAAFSADRWLEFRHDAAYFRGLTDATTWRNIRTDHGYNATPVWTVAGTLLTNTAPASDIQIFVLGLADPLFLVAMVLAICWAFGWRTVCVAVIALATYVPADSGWTAHAFLRWDWLCCLVVAVCLLKKGRPWLSGVALGYASLLRVFPAIVFALVTLALLSTRTDRTWSRFLLGGITIAMVLVPVSLVVTDGFETYQAFAANLAKTAETPYANAVGLPSVLSWRPGESVAALHDPHAIEPLRAWLDARLSAASDIGLAHVLIVGLFVALFLRTAKHAHPWMMIALATMTLPAMTNLMSYYYMVIVATALVHHESRQDAAWLLGLCAASQFIAVAPIPGMPTSLDEQYVLISVATLLVFAAILIRRAHEPLWCSSVSPSPRSRSSAP